MELAASGDVQGKRKSDGNGQGTTKKLRADGSGPLPDQEKAGKRVDGLEPTTTISKELGQVMQYNADPRFLLKLANTPADSVRTSTGRIYVANRFDKVADVLKGLVEYGFLSVPVLTKISGHYYGFVDLSDIVEFVLKEFGHAQIKSAKDAWDLLDKSADFQTKTVKDIMKWPLSRRNPFHPIKRGYSLWTAAEILAREPHLHRVPIVEEDGRLYNIVTQSQLIGLMVANLDLLGEKRNKPIALCCQSQPVITVREDAEAVEAFRIMHDKSISGVAVVNEAGLLVGDISLRDIKAVASDGHLFYRLFQPISSFMRKMVQDNIVKPTSEAELPGVPMHVRPTDTLETALRTIHKHNVHRVHIIDEQQKPIGVMSLKDILMEVLAKNHYMLHGLAVVSD